MTLVDIYENEVKPRIDYSSELSDLSPIKTAPDRYKLLCPNCGKKEAFLYTNTGIIECNRKNNCSYRTSFLAYKNGGDYPRGQDYVKAIKGMGERYGIVIDSEKSHEFIKRYEKKQSDQQILTKLWDYFRSILPNSRGAQYLESRNFPVDQKRFGMYPKTEELKRWINEQKIDLNRCQNLGLIRGDFEGRLVGDWKTKDNEICNFWARSLDGKEPKYLRLKGHAELRQDYPQGSESIKSDQIIWVEGHLDVVASNLSGLSNVVGCGTATVPDKAFQTLKPKEVILCLDNDQAGQDGTYRFIEKHRNDDLRVFVAKIPYDDCKDLADVYEKYGKEAVQEFFQEEKLIHGMTFIADHILQKSKGDEWNSYTKEQALSELITFHEKVAVKNSWKLTEFFWTRVSEALELSTEEVNEIAESIESKKKKEQIQEQAKKELNSALNLFKEGNVDEGAKLVETFNSEVQGQLTSENTLQELLKPSSEEDVIKEFQGLSDNVDTGYKISEDIAIQFPAGAISAIVAPTGHGKTRALINFSLGVLEKNPDKSVYFFTYEENKSAITSLFLNTYINEELSKNNRRSIKHYFKNIEDKEEAFKYFINGKTIPIDEGTEQTLENYFLERKKQFFKELIDSGRLNIVYSEYDAQELCQIILNLREKREDLGLVCIDYIQLLDDSIEKEKRSSRQEELKSICLKLKNCAVETGLPIVVAGQFNREVTKKDQMHPTKIGEAGDIERIANLILGIFDKRFDKSKENKIYIEVLKGREIGAGHNTSLNYNGNTGKIEMPEFSGLGTL